MIKIFLERKDRKRYKWMLSQDIKIPQMNDYCISLLTSNQLETLRGIPIDASEGIIELKNSGHSYSFLYLRELMMMFDKGCFNHPEAKPLLLLVDHLKEEREKENFCHNCMRIVYYLDDNE